MIKRAVFLWSYYARGTFLLMLINLFSSTFDNYLLVKYKTQVLLSIEYYISTIIDKSFETNFVFHVK